MHSKEYGPCGEVSWTKLSNLILLGRNELRALQQQPRIWTRAPYLLPSLGLSQYYPTVAGCSTADSQEDPTDTVLSDVTSANCTIQHGLSSNRRSRHHNTATGNHLRRLEATVGA